MIFLAEISVSFNDGLNKHSLYSNYPIHLFIFYSSGIMYYKDSLFDLLSTELKIISYLQGLPYNHNILEN